MTTRLATTVAVAVFYLGVQLAALHLVTRALVTEPFWRP